MDWDDFRLVRSVAEHGGLARAAEHLGINPSTAFRRLAAIEAAGASRTDLLTAMKPGAARNALDCALAGHAPVLCEAAHVTSPFPTGEQAVAHQRERWQRGHLGQIRTALPPLLAGLRRGDRALVALMLDVMVPPLTLLLLANAVLVAVSAAAVLAGASPLPLAIGATNAAALALAIVAGWRLAGAEGHAGGGPRAFVAYLAGNAALYQRLLTRTPVAWIRTDRGGTP